MLPGSSKPLRRLPRYLLVRRSIVDASLVAKRAQVLPACPSVRHVVVIDGVRPVTDNLRKDIVWHELEIKKSRSVRGENRTGEMDAGESVQVTMCVARL